MSASYHKVQRMRISLKLSLWDSGLHQESGNIPGPLPAVTRENHRPRTATPGKAGNTCRETRLRQYLPSQEQHPAGTDRERNSVHSD